MGDRNMITERNKLILNSGAKSSMAEAYRTLRTNIMFSSIDKSIKSIAITSAGPAEGKSTVAANFAIALAQAGSKVLIIDSDLRKPKIHKLFCLPNNIGLTNILIEHMNWEEYIASVEELPNLYVMTSGPIPPNPTEILGSERMMGLISKIKEKFNFVILDTPPVGVVTDAAVISSYVDGAILVVASGNVEIEAAQRAKALLSNVKANILGVVLNKVPTKGAGYYKYYYYGGYYDDEVRKKKRKVAKFND